MVKGWVVSVAQSEQSQSNGIIVGEVKSNKKTILAIVAALVSLGLIVTGLYFGYRHFAAKKETKPTVSEKSAEQIFAEKDTANQSALEKELATAKTAKERSVIYVKLANAVSADKDKSIAYEYAKKAVSEDKTVDSLVLLAIWAEQNNDKKAAAEAYGKAADLARASDTESSENEYNHYKAMQEAVLAQ